MDELDDKLEIHPETVEAGFVVDREPEIDDEIMTRIGELELVHSIKMSILTFDEWVDHQVERSGLEESAVMDEWLVAYAESLALRRLEAAPIDEPADRWLEDLFRLLSL